MDPEYTARLEELSTAVEDKELVLIQLLEDSRGALGLSHIAVQTFIGRQNLGVTISEKKPDYWNEFCASMLGAADDLKRTAAELRQPELARGMQQSARAKAAAEKKAVDLENSAADISEIAEKVQLAVLEVIEARALLETFTADDDGASEATDGKKGGACTAEMRSALASYKIAQCRFWNGQLTGGNCRLMCTHQDAILTQVQNKIDSQFPNGFPDNPGTSALASSFKARHGAILGSMDIIGHYTRKVEILTAHELDCLDSAIADFKANWGKSYDNRILTPKAELVVNHVSAQARFYGTLGVMGEDGIESLHQMDSSIRLLVRSVRNPSQRQAAHVSHMAIQQNFRKRSIIPKRKRRNRAQIAADTAAAAAAVAAAEAPGVEV